MMKKRETVETTLVDIDRLLRDLSTTNREFVLQALDIGDGIVIPEFATLEAAMEAAEDYELPRKVREAALKAWEEFSQAEVARVSDLNSAVEAWKRCPFGDRRDEVGRTVEKFAMLHVSKTDSLDEDLALLAAFKEIGMWSGVITNELHRKIASRLENLNDLERVKHLLPPVSDRMDALADYVQHPILIRWRALVRPLIASAPTEEYAWWIRTITPPQTPEMDDIERKIVELTETTEGLAKIYSARNHRYNFKRYSVERWLEIAKPEIDRYTKEQLEDTVQLARVPTHSEKTPSEIIGYVQERLNLIYADEVRNAQTYEEAETIFRKTTSEDGKNNALLRMAELLPSFEIGKEFFTNYLSRRNNSLPAVVALSSAVALKARQHQDLLWSYKDLDLTKEAMAEIIRRLAPFYPRVLIPAE